MKKLKLKKLNVVLLCLLGGFLTIAFCYFMNDLNQRRKIASQELEDQNISFVEYDLTSFEGVSLQKRIKYRLFENAKWVSDKHNHNLIFGNSKFKNAKGKTVELCDEVSLIELVFRAEGVVISGDAPKIILRTKCVADHSAEHLNPIAIPWRLIKNLNPNTKEYKTTSDVLYFRSVDDFWPLEWTFLEMRLYSNDGKSLMQTSGYDVLTIRNFPLNFYLLSWDRWPK